MARARLARALALALFLAASRPARGALGDDWPTVSAARRAVARVTGAPLRAALCAVSNCRDGGLPTPPGGRYARWGPYDTRLVALTDTDRYGFPDALVACPVAPPPDAADVPGGDLLRALLRGVGLSSPPSAPVSPEPRPTALPVSLPGVAWSHGGSGSCDGTSGFANTADGYSPEMTGDDKGYWLPDALEHLASWGVVAACPSLPGGVPVGDGASTLNAARMLAERQPCRRDGAIVREDKLALAGYSLGAGRALRAASAATNTGASPSSPPVAAVVALHPWGAGGAGPVDAPLLIVSATEDTNAPFREARRAFDRATGPKVIAALRGGNHYASPRFWSGATTAFLLAHLAGDPEAEAEVWGAEGLAGDPRLTRVDRRCGWWRGATACA